MLFSSRHPDHKKVKFHPRILGSAAPVFPGFEVDICDPVDDDDRPDAVWHRQRAKKMIRAHPEIRNLFGNTPGTAFWCVLFAVMQVGLAAAVGGMSWWLVLLLAYLVGTLIDTNLFQLGHECNHNLVFRKPLWNRWLFTFCTLPMFMPGHHTWWIEHRVHHNDLGARKDFIKRRRTVFLLTRQDHYLWVVRHGLFYRLLCVLFSPVCMPYGLFMLVLQVLRSLLGLLVFLFGWVTRRQLDPSAMPCRFWQMDI